MDFTVDAAVLAETLRKASVALPRGSSEADYKLTELDIKRRKLSATCTDGEFVCTATCPCANDGAETFLVDGRKLLALAERSVGDLRCALAGKFIVKGTHQATIRCQNGAHKRRAVDMLACKFYITEEQVKHLSVASTVADYTPASAMNIGVLAKDEKAILAAYDIGFSAFLEIPCVGEVETKIPVGYLKAAIGVGATSVEIFGNLNIKMSGEDVVCYLPSVEGKIIDPTKYADYAEETVLEIDRGILPIIELAREFGLTRTEKNRDIYTGTVTYKNNKLSIHAIGDGEVNTQQVPVIGRGPAVTDKFSLKFLQGAVHNMGQCAMHIHKHPYSPNYWILLERDGMRYVIMPLS